MKYYITTLIFRISIPEEKYPQFDEQIRLIEAEDGMQAYEKARLIGLHEEEQFVSAQGRAIGWNFIDITNIFEIANFTDGAELYSYTSEPENESQYLALIREKANALKNRFSEPV
jgi:hypothetical protein